MGASQTVKPTQKEIEDFAAKLYTGNNALDKRLQEVVVEAILRWEKEKRKKKHSITGKEEHE